jgi:hypothetical protein
MKTKIISTLKHELLIIEHPEETYFEVFTHGILFKDHLSAEREFIEGSYTLLGKHDEIKDEDVKGLVEIVGEDDLLGTFYKDYKNPHYMMQPNSALESFNSALEKEILWENPYGKEPFENLQSSTFGGEKTIIHRNPMNILWRESESRTFDRNRTLIFIKN